MLTITMESRADFDNGIVTVTETFTTDLGITVLTTNHKITDVMLEAAFGGTMPQVMVEGAIRA